MYAIDKKDQVVELADIPKPDAGAPAPILLADEDRLIVAYYVQGPPIHWDPAELEDPDFEDVTASVSFDFLSFMFGYPNDEAIFGHPLYKRGLRPYGAYEVLDSSWVRKLERMNRAHGLHSPEFFLSFRHIILTFHDTMLECATRHFTVGQANGSPSSAVRKTMSHRVVED
jgi:hypothetical protein